MQISPRNKKIFKDLLFIIVLIVAYEWKGIPMLASFIVGWIIIKKFSKSKEQD